MIGALGDKLSNLFKGQLRDADPHGKPDPRDASRRRMALPDTARECVTDRCGTEIALCPCTPLTRFSGRVRTIRRSPMRNSGCLRSQTKRATLRWRNEFSFY